MSKTTNSYETTFNWTRNQADNCLAKWNNLLLRVEEMDDNFWSWSVRDTEQNEFQIDTSSNYDEKVLTVEAARQKAEECALAYQRERLKNAEVGQLNITKRFFYVSMIALLFLVIKILFIDNLIIGNPSHYHLSGTSNLFNFFYPSTTTKEVHPEPSTLNHALTFLVGCLVGWGIIRFFLRNNSSK